MHRSEACTTPITRVHSVSVSAAARLGRLEGDAQVLLEDDARWLSLAEMGKEDNHSFTLLLGQRQEQQTMVTGTLKLSPLLDSSEACLRACSQLDEEHQFKGRRVSALHCEVLWAGMETKRQFLRMRLLYAASVEALVSIRTSEGRPLFFVQLGAHIGNTTNDPVFAHANTPGAEWAGLLVEPDSRHLEALARNYQRARKRANPEGAEGTAPLLFDNSAVCDEGTSSATFYTVSAAVQSQLQKMWLGSAWPLWLDQIGSLDEATFRHNLREALRALQAQGERGSALADLGLIVDQLVAAGKTTVRCSSWAQLLRRAKVEGGAGAERNGVVDAVYIDCEGQDATVVRMILRENAPVPAILCYEHAHQEEQESELLLDELRGPEGHVCMRRGQEDTCCVAKWLARDAERRAIELLGFD